MCEQRDAYAGTFERLCQLCVRDWSPLVVIAIHVLTSGSGAPGSGKSTFCRWVGWLTCAGAMPQHEIAAPQGYVETFPESFRDRLPVLIRLREFWEYLPQTPGGRSLTQVQLEQALAKWLEATRPGGLTWDLLASHLENGSTLLIWDGVDEVPHSYGPEQQACDPHQMLVSGLSSAIPRWRERGNLLLATSRPYGLTDSEVAELGLQHAPI